MATTLEKQPELAPAVREALESLRSRIRWYVWLEGLALAVAWLGAAFWVSLGIDWFLEPPIVVRRVLLFLIGAGFAYVLFHWIGCRAFVRLSNSNMATLLERRFPELDDTLLTAVLLTGHELSEEDCNPEMLARTCREASERIGSIRLGEVFNWRPLVRNVIAAVLLAGSVVTFVSCSPYATKIWASRALLFQDRLWPRHCDIIVEGFTRDPNNRRTGHGRFDGASVKVARGADFDLIAKADCRYELIPQSVHVRYRTRGRKNKPMNREGTADPEKDDFQRYAYTIRGILTPVRFDLVGGDARIRNLKILVVDSPTVTSMQLDCEYPKYMDRKTRTLDVSGAMQIPQGTKITVRADANKPLTRVQIDMVTEEDLVPVKTLEIDQPTTTFEYEIPSLDADTTLLFTLSDTDGITAREPVRLALLPTPDTAPEIAARLDGIGQAITPIAVVPTVGRIKDDHAIAESWFETTIENADAQKHSFATPEPHTADMELDDRFEVDQLSLAPGQKLVLAVKASDRYDLGEDKKPNVGTSERWLLDVVTAEQLRAMLEARELVLRQRLESIRTEVTETRDLLLRLDFGKADAENTSEGGAGGEAESDPGREPGDEPSSDEPGDEPGDEPAADSDSPMRQLSRRTVRVQRALTNARKSTHETQGVADAFDDIRKQLVNNRIDAEQLKIRLAEGIVEPLNDIAQEMFPELETRLVALQSKLDDTKIGPTRAVRARQQADDILLAIQRVLDRIIELEDFNEAIELLREIIKLENQLKDQTDKRHKQKLRELLED